VVLYLRFPHQNSVFSVVVVWTVYDITYVYLKNTVCFIMSFIISPIFNRGSITIENLIHMIFLTGNEFLNCLRKNTKQSA
jgi:hypothetical protein